MDRDARQTYDSASYPLLQELPDRRTMLRRLLAGAAGLPVAWLVGCPGGIDDNDWGMDTLFLPPEPDTRLLVLADGGALEYRIVATVREDLAYDCLDTSTAPALDGVMERIDEVLYPHGTGEFAEGESLAAMETEIVLALHVVCDSYDPAHELFMALDLVVVEVG